MAHGSTSLRELVAAILADDAASVKRLLSAERGLAVERLGTAKLYTSEIFHWIYAGDTVLHLAAAGYRTEIIKLLLAAGAEVNAAGTHRAGRPLHYAADGAVGIIAWDDKSQVQTIELLGKSGASINAQDKNGATALHRAVRNRCAAAVRALLDAGANWRLKNKPGSTAFHLAVQNTGRGGSGTDDAKAGQRAIIELFLALHVPTDLKDGKGKSVVDCIKSEWVREMLLSD